MKKVIEISNEGRYLSLKHRQLILSSTNKKTLREPATTIPCEDIGVLVIDHPQTTYTHPSLVELLKSGTAIVFCGEKHLPTGMALPLATHSLVVKKQLKQIESSKPNQKRIWQQLIRSKINSQANNLLENSATKSQLLALKGQVKSGDPENIEGLAAKLYWQALFDSQIDFRRDPNGSGINGLLNYGYAIVRAGIGRAIVSSGLNPTLGIHHKHRANSFALADDLIEPFRPLVDKVVLELVQNGINEVTPASKQHLLGVLHLSIHLIPKPKTVGPLMSQLPLYLSSFFECLIGKKKVLKTPAWDEGNLVPCI